MFFKTEAKPAVKATAGVKLLKSQGTDDGFHSEASLCGKSIVHVANQMMAGKFVKSNNINSDQQQQNDNIPMKGIIYNYFNNRKKNVLF